MTSQTRKQITIPIFVNILRSKVNQTMKSGQLTEYYMRYMFLEKLYAKCVEEATTRPFHKKSKLSISLDQESQIF